MCCFIQFRESTLGFVCEQDFLHLYVNINAVFDTKSMQNIMQ